MACVRITLPRCSSSNQCWARSRPAVNWGEDKWAEKPGEIIWWMLSYSGRRNWLRWTPVATWVRGPLPRARVYKVSSSWKKLFRASQEPVVKKSSTSGFFAGLVWFGFGGFFGAPTILDQEVSSEWRSGRSPNPPGRDFAKNQSHAVRGISKALSRKLLSDLTLCLCGLRGEGLVPPSSRWGDGPSLWLPPHLQGEDVDLWKELMPFRSSAFLPSRKASAVGLPISSRLLPSVPFMCRRRRFSPMLVSSSYLNPLFSAAFLLNVSSLQLDCELHEDSV